MEIVNIKLDAITNPTFQPCGRPEGIWCLEAYESILPLQGACLKVQKEDPEHCKPFKKNRGAWKKLG